MTKLEPMTEELKEAQNLRTREALNKSALGFDASADYDVLRAARRGDLITKADAANMFDAKG